MCYSIHAKQFYIYRVGVNIGIDVPSLFPRGKELFGDIKGTLCGRSLNWERSFFIARKIKYGRRAMKKIVIILLSVFLLICCTFGLTACGGGGDDSGDNQNTEQPNNPDDGNEDDDSDGEQTNPPVTETRIAVKAYIDGSLYETIYTSESEGYKIETPTVPDDITTNPNSERYFYGWFVDRNFQTPVPMIQRSATIRLSTALGLMCILIGLNTA